MKSLMDFFQVFHLILETFSHLEFPLPQEDLAESVHFYNIILLFSCEFADWSQGTWFPRLRQV